jgi:hypothetical protein
MAYYQFNGSDEFAEFTDYTPSNAMKVSKAVFQRGRQAYAVRKLLEILKPGDTVYTAANGKAHDVLVARVSDEGRPYIHRITHLVADAAGFRRNKDGAIVQGGSGYSRSFQICYSLGFTLWPNGTPEPHGMRNGEPDTAGGYALKHDSI